MKKVMNLVKTGLCLYASLFSSLTAKGWQENAPVEISAVMPVRNFVSAHGRLERSAWPDGTPPRNTMITLPTITVYSPTGQVLYSEGSQSPEVIARNLSILKDFPDSVKDFKPLLYLPTLSSMLDIVPEFKAKSERILHDRHYVIYVAIPVNPNRITHLEQELTAIRNKPDNEVDILIVGLNM
jgi:hypothetical protein